MSNRQFKSRTRVGGLTVLALLVLACCARAESAQDAEKAQHAEPLTARSAAPRESLSADPMKLATTSPASAALESGNAGWGPLQLVVYKSRRALAVYRFGNFYRQYPVVLGANPVGRKRFMYDARTPEGQYHIIDKRVHERWQYFLALDYPNEEDRQIYDDEARRNVIPRQDDGQLFPIGGNIGIHGNDKPGEQERGENWTQGCIAMRSADIAEIYSMVEIGTPVWVVE